MAHWKLAQYYTLGQQRIFCPIHRCEKRHVARAMLLFHASVGTQWLFFIFKNNIEILLLKSGIYSCQYVPAQNRIIGPALSLVVCQVVNTDKSPQIFGNTVICPYT